MVLTAGLVGLIGRIAEVKSLLLFPVGVSGCVTLGLSGNPTNVEGKCRITGHFLNGLCKFFNHACSHCVVGGFIN